MEEVIPRSRLREYDGKPCPYCGRTMGLGDPRDYPSRDHKLSRHRGGKDEPDNLIVVCSRCNVVKATMTTEEYMEFKALLGPRFDYFSDTLFVAATPRAGKRQEALYQMKLGNIQKVIESMIEELEHRLSGQVHQSPGLIDAIGLLQAAQAKLVKERSLHDLREGRLNLQQE